VYVEEDGLDDFKRRGRSMCFLFLKIIRNLHYDLRLFNIFFFVVVVTILMFVLGVTFGFFCLGKQLRIEGE
jgi:hypothetical protein